MALAQVTLDDKYTLESGRIYLTGIQALVRLTIMQRERDAAAGLNTAGFVSGYRGSPLGGLDQAFWKARAFLEPKHIHFRAGINEDLAATSVWGTQQVNMFDGARFEGVFGMWYGKGPGVDRSGDVFKHANAAGTSRYGGVLVIAGDDHACKSSTLPHQSEYGYESDDDDEYREEDRCAHFLRRSGGDLEALFSAEASSGRGEVAVDVLGHDDPGVHHDADRYGDAAQRHDV